MDDINNIPLFPETPELKDILLTEDKSAFGNSPFGKNWEKENAGRSDLKITADSKVPDAVIKQYNQKK